MKKRLIAVGLLTAMILAGCGAKTDVPETTAHTHAAEAAWNWNGTEHWHACSCGEKMEAAAHNPGDDMRCADCGVEIWAMDDGYVDASGYDQYGNLLKRVSYDPDGNILSTVEYAYTYDDQGNIMSAKYYSDGVLQSLDEYVLDGEGYPRIVKYTYYYENGEVCVDEYDENGEIIHTLYTAADGSLLAESWSEYAVDEDGNIYECKLTGVDTEKKYTCEYNRYGDVTYRAFFDLEGNLDHEDVWEYGYNDEGQMEWMKQYRDGVLTDEITGYAERVTEDYSMRYPETVIAYYEDGTKLVSYSGELGEVETETLYNADGSVASVTRYVYETFEDGNWKRITVYKDDVMICDTEYVMDEEMGWSRKFMETEYHEDGSKTVFEYDENEEVVSEIRYDAAGNEI